MQPVSHVDEVSRLSAVLGPIVGLGRPCSIDTLKSSTAAWALDQGASILNDVWGLQGDPNMAKLAARRHTPVVCMHNRQSSDPSIDIIADVLTFFGRTLEIASQAGIAREQIVLDPGIGFGKTPEQSITCIAHFGEFRTFGLPLLLGVLSQALHRQRVAVRAGRPDWRFAREPVAWRAAWRRHRSRA